MVQLFGWVSGSDVIAGLFIILGILRLVYYQRVRRWGTLYFAMFYALGALWMVHNDALVYAGALAVIAILDMMTGD